MKTTNKIRKFLTDNISTTPYEMLRFNVVDFYPKYVIDWEKVSQYLIEKANKDLQLFKDREDARLKSDKPHVGDYIKRKDGRLTQIGIFTYNGNFQDTPSSTPFLYKDGGASHSGGFTMDVLNVANLKPLKQTKDLRCWIFSGDFAGGNCGVYSTIKTKVWKEV